ncbi:hypothetical protein AQJ30_23835 [Streptomyces longwoodensis]|uniref:Uncharacterized protein n=1 Tax=Streptomyces longwoodensis TaxID=68231 RepID=A0A101QTN5_9ACTN|nr:hypothetical protein [Streptomyces longwoodensis]KUN35723.1 hypothetical protein AQJ30_23835 [Streptomyces longwoodensis]
MFSFVSSMSTIRPPARPACDRLREIARHEGSEQPVSPIATPDRAGTAVEGAVVVDHEQVVRKQIHLLGTGASGLV